MPKKRTRRSLRQEDDRVIIFRIHQDKSPTEYLGVLVNSGDEGFAFLSSKSLEVGEIIRLERKNGQPVPCHIGLLVWTEEVKEGSLYKVGVECID